MTDASDVERFDEIMSTICNLVDEAAGIAQRTSGGIGTNAHRWQRRIRDIVKGTNRPPAFAPDMGDTLAAMREKVDGVGP